MGNLSGKISMSGVPRAWHLECSRAVPARSKRNDRFDNTVYQFDFLRFRAVENGIKLRSQGLLSLFAFEKQQVMRWDAQRPGHRSDCIQARHLSASLDLGPIVRTQPCALSGLLQAKLLSLPELPNALAEQGTYDTLPIIRTFPRESRACRTTL